MASGTDTAPSDIVGCADHGVDMCEPCMVNAGFKPIAPNVISLRQH